MSKNSVKLNIELVHGEFNEVELKNIVLDARLAEIAISDPKWVKRYALYDVTETASDAKIFYIYFFRILANQQ